MPQKYKLAFSMTVLFSLGLYLVHSNQPTQDTASDSINIAITESYTTSLDSYLNQSSHQEYPQQHLEVPIILPAAEKKAPQQEPVAAQKAAQKEPVAAQKDKTVDESPRYTEIQGAVRSGETLSACMNRLRIPSHVAKLIQNKFAKFIDSKRLRPQDKFCIVLNEDGGLQKCTYEAGPLEVYEISKTNKGYEAAKVAVTLERKIEKVSGTITSSLFEAFADAGEQPRLIHPFADIFGSKIDFNTETKKGDVFHIIVEKYYKDDEFIRYGRILAAQYFHENKILEGFYQEVQGRKAYFNRKGEELGASFIKSPLPVVSKVTSSFTHSRLHPILGVVRPHLGIDLSAPYGTPVMAAADGKVVSANWQNGFGKQIVIRHAGGVQSYYGHLAQFAKKLVTGATVKQKEIIGYVGSTGMSTGPHLDYRLTENGDFKNPFSLKFLPRSSLAGKQLATFKQAVNTQIAFLEKRSKKLVLEVKNVTYQPDKPLTFL